ncbi:DUF1788 domain-containing protein [Lacticaseibacillus zhaodongensis]|uniref:DUF1788 domain-containing protein n=1 Tax=Lacticaseibacillus zhaodongensis TaxID=2668065 RepID=UPI0012D2D63E|nr:DUF1788 domain-containing protein [Lacticaseibacillus zhaodongensis]
MDKLTKDFINLREKISSPTFQANEGLSNEVGYYIFSYDPAQEMRVREEITNLVTTATPATINASIQVFDLFKIMMHIVDEFGYREQFADFEKQYGMSSVIEQMERLLRMNRDDNRIVEYIQKHLRPGRTIIFVTGVGAVFPLVRAHKVLNTMNQVIDNVPVVMFYPGMYDSVRLKMFGELQDDNYYRAFSLNS